MQSLLDRDGVHHFRRVGLAPLIMTMYRFEPKKGGERTVAKKKPAKKKAGKDKFKY